MTVEELSNRIIQGDLFSEEGHYICTQNDYDFSNTNIAHYGVLGMKWGVRKKRETTIRKRKKTSSKTISKEKAAKLKYKEKLRALKAKEKYEKKVIKSQERIDAAKAKSEAKVRRVTEVEDAKTASKVRKAFEKKELPERRSEMSDQDLQATINRIRNEKQLKELTKKPPGVFSKAATAVLIPVGLAIVKGQMTKIANEKIDDYRTKKKEEKEEKRTSAQAAAEAAKEAWSRMQEGYYSMKKNRSSSSSSGESERVRAKKVDVDSTYSPNRSRGDVIDVDFEQVFENVFASKYSDYTADYDVSEYLALPPRRG